VTNDASSNSDGLAGPLSGLRVLELADEKGQFCGKLMGDLGADVIKIEPRGGQNTRSVGPFYKDIPHPDRSLSFWHYNTSKRGITLNLESTEGRELFLRLTATADIVLETFPPGYLPALGLGYKDLAAGNPGLVVCSLTPFGQTGPWRDYLTCDLAHLAAGGQMASSGYDSDDVADAPPIAPGGGNAWHIGSHYAYMGIMAALFYRDTTGEGQYIDASVHEACALTTEGAIAIYLSTGEVVQRHTGRHASPDNSVKIQLPTQDGGWVNVTRSGSALNPARLRRLAEWMDEHGLAQDLLDEKYQDLAHHRRAGQLFRQHAPRGPMDRRSGAGLPLGSDPDDGRDHGRPASRRPGVLRGSGTPGTGPKLYLSRSGGDLQRLALGHLPPRPVDRRAQRGYLLRGTGAQ